MATERGVQREERGPDPGPRGERAVYGFALYLGTYALMGAFSVQRAYVVWRACTVALLGLFCKGNGIGGCLDQTGSCVLD